MSFFVVTLAGALGIALVTGGSLGRILDTRLAALPALFAALGIQLALDLFWDGPSTTAGHLLLVASYGLLMVFCAANFSLKGLTVVAIGIALNALVVTVNHGMPIRTAGTFEATVKHHAERPADRLMPLADIIIVSPINQALSFGDLIMVVGLVDVLFHRSRSGATRRRPTADRPPVAA